MEVARYERNETHAWSWEIAAYTNFVGFSIWAKGSAPIAERWWPSEEASIPILANAQLIAAAPELLEVAHIEHALHMRGFTKATATSLGPDALDALPFWADLRD